MSNILNQISLKIMKRIGTRLRWRKENLFQRLFFNGKIIEDCLTNSTIDEVLESYNQAIRFKKCNLNVIKKVSMEDKLLQYFSSSDWACCIDCKTTLQKAEMTEVRMKECKEEIAFENINNPTPIQKFYYGERFIGKFLIEKSLRTDPDTNHIYLLILPKKEENALTQ
ncbi:fatty acyl-CoA reductase wat-like isoform X2 [Vespula maculifrons]|uniref:Fatty acyl-CoA reductase wat-like isoform X2 n=1 Tax=Vespula maculifrons TaxID=7453 RepID=A0ABD2BPF7_VESMC